MDQNKINILNSELDKWKKWFNSEAKKWGFAYHFCLYGTTIIALLIGFLTQIQFESFTGVSKIILIDSTKINWVLHF